MRIALARNVAAAVGLWLAAAVMTPAAAAIVFQDNFDGQTLGLNASLVNWSVTDGTVDVIGPGLFDLLPGNGHYVDLDGSTSNAGVLTTTSSFLFEAGQTYTLSFDLAGSQRNDTNQVTVALGSFVNEVFTLASGNPFATITRVFTPLADTTANLSFSNAGGDNLGALLDRVRIESQQQNGVPEPGTVGLIGLALALLASRRRRT